ncbi:hypothetical protein [Kitasatospora sp. HPMI-4]|uniref:hypothetical protein n=1 Tax=Kitasatospora sp. HPMI-4 TaxID=3448443 RepID=UPI003F1DD961
MIRRFPARDLIAVPAVFALTRAPEIAGFAATFGSGFLVKAAGLNFWLGAPAMFLIGLSAVHAVADLPRRPRPLGDVALELADRVADWAGWAWHETDTATDPYEGEVTR